MAKCTTMEKDMTKLLTEDLMSDILVRLPVNSLMRCRCVCKAWYHLIKSPNFVDMHLKRNTSKTDLILLHRSIDLDNDILSVYAYESLNFITKFTWDFRFEISGPCNGLFCLLNPVEQLKLLNPSTHESTDLPPSSFPCPEGWSSYVEGFGIGFVSNPNDYKVISLVSFYESCEGEYIDEDAPDNKVQIYELSKNSWREIECDCPYVISDRYGTLFNGALHWIAEREAIEIIPSFNLSTEVFRDIELPDDVLAVGILKSLTIVDNSLALFAYTTVLDSEEKIIDIWVMRQYGVAESWTKQLRIGPLSEISRPLMLWKNEAILLESKKQLLSYALDTHEFEEFETQGDMAGIRVMAYHESLISLR